MTLTHILNIDKEIQSFEMNVNANDSDQNCTNCLIELGLKDNESHTNQHKGEESVTQSDG